MKKVNYINYIAALAISIIILFTTFYFSNLLNNKKIDSLENIQESISYDILETETQFLLKEISCAQESNVSIVKKINDLGERVTYMEEALGSDNLQVLQLKKYYSLLQIKDYLLGKKVNSECYKFKNYKQPIYMIYMYSNKSKCDDCRNQAYALYDLKQKYPELKVYTFDYDIDVAPVKTLINIYNVKPEFPVLIIEDKPYYGLQSSTEIETNFRNNIFNKLNNATNTVLNSTSKTQIASTSADIASTTDVVEDSRSGLFIFDLFKSK